MIVFYAITFAAALLLLGIYFRVDRERSPWLMLLFVFVALCNGGYLGLILSRDLKYALLFNATAYLGNVFLPFFILMMILQLSQLTCRKWLTGLLIGVNCVTFLITASGGILPIYYKEVSLEVVDGVASLVKVYGPFHGLYKVFLFGYFAAMVAVIAVTGVKKTAVSTKHTMFLAGVVLGNLVLWLAENLSGLKFEFLTISYLMTESLILLLYGILQDYENAVRSAAVSASDGESTENSPFTAAQTEMLFSTWHELACLSTREREVLRFLLENRRRKDIAQVLFVSESTVKKHTGNIYKKLEVSNREELFQLAGKQFS